MFRAVALSSCRLIPTAFRASANGRRFSTAAANSMLAKALDSKIKHITQSVCYVANNDQFLSVNLINYNLKLV